MNKKEKRASIRQPESSLISDLFFQTSRDNFQLLYDCFFQIFKDRQARALPLFSDEDHTHAIPVEDKERRIQFYMNKILTIEDYLYLPSHVTSSRREEMLKKHGKLILQIEHNFEVVARHLAQEAQNRLQNARPEVARVLDDVKKKRNVLVEMVERADQRGEEAVLQQVATICERRFPQQVPGLRSKADEKKLKDLQQKVYSLEARVEESESDRRAQNAKWAKKYQALLQELTKAEEDKEVMRQKCYEELHFARQQSSSALAGSAG